MIRGTEKEAIHPNTRSTPTLDPAELGAKWRALRHDEPGLRPHDAAERLGVSAAELLAAGCGDHVTRLTGDFGQLVRALSRLGVVLAVTGNLHAVYEKKGRYGYLGIHGVDGRVLDDQIDLHCVLRHWCLGFAVQEAVEGHPRLSLQFCDREGSMVHQVFLTRESRRDVYETLVERYCAKDQSPGPIVAAWPAAAPEKAEEPIDRPGPLVVSYGTQNVRDFFQIHQMCEAGRTQAWRRADRTAFIPVAASSVSRVLERACTTETPITVHVGNRGALQIHSGPVRWFQRTGVWLEMRDESSRLHLREHRIASGWVLSQPTVDGIVTSLELYDEADEPIAFLSGQRRPGEGEQESWRRLLADLPMSDVPALKRSA